MARLLYFLTLIALALSAEAKVYGAMRVRLDFGLVGRQACGEGNTCAEACATCGPGNVQCGDVVPGLDCNCYNPSAGETCCNETGDFCLAGEFCAGVRGFCCLAGTSPQDCASQQNFTLPATTVPPLPPPSSTPTSATSNTTSLPTTSLPTTSLPTTSLPTTSLPTTSLYTNSSVPTVTPSSPLSPSPAKTATSTPNRTTTEPVKISASSGADRTRACLGLDVALLAASIALAAAFL